MITLLFLFFNKILLLTYIINYLLEYELKKKLIFIQRLGRTWRDAQIKIYHYCQGPGNDFYPGGVRINKKIFQKIFYYINP